MFSMNLYGLSPYFAPGFTFLGQFSYYLALGSLRTFGFTEKDVNGKLNMLRFTTSIEVYTIAMLLNTLFYLCFTLFLDRRRMLAFSEKDGNKGKDKGLLNVYDDVTEHEK